MTKTMLTAKAVITGHSHAAAAEEGQDSAATRLSADGLTAVIAVADGAGSSPMGGQGAQTAAETAAAEALKELADVDPDSAPEALARAADAARGAVAQLAESSGHPLSNYHTTLIIGACGHNWAAAAHSGDGCAVLTTAEGEHTLLSAPDQGEYANETTFITAPDWPAGLRTSHAENAGHQGLILMTDGLQRLALSYGEGNPAPYEPFFTALTGWLKKAGSEKEAGDALLALANRAAGEKRTLDDVTIAAAWPAP